MAILIFTGITLIFGILLGYAAIRFRVEGDPVADKIDALLPQTQCGQCGYPGCRPYAEAIAKGDADINLCPPGGDAGVRALADLMNVDVKPLENEDAASDEDVREVAIINEQDCIGCTKCIQICPVDAIIGAPKQQHTVLETYCTGCELCLPPLCPVENCIVMEPVTASLQTWHWSDPENTGKDQAA